MKISALLCAFLSCSVFAGEPARLEPAGAWQVKVTCGEISAVFPVDPPDVVTVTDEKYDVLAAFAGPVWRRGTPLCGPKAEACSVADALESASLVVRDGTGTTARTFSQGKDYQLEPRWAGFGRLEGGAIPADKPVFASYRYALMRLDSVALTAGKKLVLRRGIPHVATPCPPELAAGETRVGNVWLSGRIDKLTAANLFPVLETTYPEPPRMGLSAAVRLLPKTLSKLQSGGTVKILAWGDSVTECVYLPLQQKWQEQFAMRLRERFPKASIVMLSAGWGGRTTTAFRNEPPGSPHNYAEKILALKPDLVVSEFINDAYMNEAAVLENYGAILKDFKKIGAEWIILTPHYARPDWMGLKEEIGIDQDPRPYVHGLRLFAENNRVALADASLRWGRLWRQGVPYSTLLVNNINHPNEQGMRLFADALMGLFP
ncbi:MAG TPA: SGNH/GDSL hydrolase family protein [Kiritimatiellia bacterium]|nr:SGNH/GDSL hydrolase family protein [Kiritimatiellia bacterium]HPS08292.1 SGNH/GDSL hydrolase family protein [Kiritimatiellia bacterium]